MSSTKDPAFLFYTKDFDSGTKHWDVACVGAYLRLLMHQHQHDKIPLEKEKLMRITGVFDGEQWDVIWEEIGCKFKQMDKHMLNERLNHEVNLRRSNAYKKIASATLGGLLASNKDLNDKQRKDMRKAFDIKLYEGMSNEEIKKSVKEWFNQMLKHMLSNIVNVDANVNANANSNTKYSDIVVNEKKALLAEFFECQQMPEPLRTHNGFKRAWLDYELERDSVADSQYTVRSRTKAMESLWEGCKSNIEHVIYSLEQCTARQYKQPYAIDMDKQAKKKASETITDLGLPAHRFA